MKSRTRQTVHWRRFLQMIAACYCHSYRSLNCFLRLNYKWQKGQNWRRKIMKLTSGDFNLFSHVILLVSILSYINETEQLRLYFNFGKGCSYLLPHLTSFYVTRTYYALVSSVSETSTSESTVTRALPSFDVPSSDSFRFRFNIPTRVCAFAVFSSLLIGTI